jgi:hypothetical protein
VPQGSGLTAWEWEAGGGGLESFSQGREAGAITSGRGNLHSALGFSPDYEALAIRPEAIHAELAPAARSNEHT